MFTRLYESAMGQLTDAPLAEHFGWSMFRVFSAFLLACVTAIPIGIAMGVSRIARGIFDPPIEFYRPLPPLAYLPLIVIWFGIDELSKVLLIYLACFAPLAMSARAGVRSVSQEQIHAALLDGRVEVAGDLARVIPAAMPEILTSMRIAIGFGWTTLVAAEMVAATHGLGQMVLNASNFLRTDIVIMGIIVIGAIAYLFDLLMRYVERARRAVEGQGLKGRSCGLARASAAGLESVGRRAAARRDMGASQARRGLGSRIEPHEPEATTMGTRGNLTTCALAALAALFAHTVAAQGTIVTCESQNYQNAECPIAGGPVAIIRQLSTPPGDCIEGQTWGFNGYNNTIWVTGGCRAEFRTGYGGGVRTAPSSAGDDSGGLRIAGLSQRGVPGRRRPRGDHPPTEHAARRLHRRPDLGIQQLQQHDLGYRWVPAEFRTGYGGAPHARPPCRRRRWSANRRTIATRNARSPAAP